MFDLKVMQLIKTIEVPQGFSADGIYCDTSNDRVYIGSHPTKSLMVVDAKDGTVLGNVDLGGVPEQTVADGKGTVYQVLQDRPGRRRCTPRTGSDSSCRSRARCSRRCRQTDTSSSPSSS